MDLQSTWFILLFVLLGGYAILDGFDLGVGMLHLTGRTDGERRLGLQAIGPVWDGNEVWLITAGGALFAAFPFVYATVFSSMYLALFVLLVALIGRAAAIEFRSKEESPRWRAIWDYIFFICSLLPAILFGVALGNILRGLPMEPVNGELRFTGDFLSLLHPFCIGVGVLSALLFLMQGAIYLAMKSDGRQQQRMRTLVPIFWMGVVVLYVVLSVFAMMRLPHLYDAIIGTVTFGILLGVICIAMLAVPLLTYSRRYGTAFVASSAIIAGMMALAAYGLFPRLVVSTSALANSLTIHAHSSSPRTLRTMLVIALFGMPFVIAYTVIVYRIFKGKTRVDPHGY